MKIKEIKAHILVSELREPFGFSQWWYDSRKALLVEVTTSDGLEGWGECYGPPGPIAAIIEEFTPLLVGEDSTAIDRIWESVYNRFRDFGQRGLIIEALSGIDIALWDLFGKRYGVSSHRLMGGPIRCEVEAYATGLYRRNGDGVLAALQEEAVGYVRSGLKGVKMKVGFGIAEDVRLVTAVREALGPEPVLMIDANHAYDSTAAVSLGRKLERFDIGWFEEPVPPEDLAGYAIVKSKIAIPIAGGECAWTRFGFRDILVQNAMDIVQPDVCSAGGLSECKKIAIMANAFGVRCNPHCWGTGVALAATLQLLAVIPHSPLSMNPTEPVLELDQTEHPFRLDLLTQPISHEQGIVAIPDLPGLGIEVNRAVMERYKVN